MKYGYVAWSTPFVIVSTAFSNLVRAKGKSTEALNGILIGTIQNIVLNRLFILWLRHTDSRGGRGIFPFILWLGYRIAGAAWATAIGYTAANAYYVILLTGKDSHLTISIACFNMRKETVGPSQAVIRLSCFAGLGMGVILTLLCGVFSEELISCVIDSEGIREYGTPLVRTLLLSGPVMGILFIYINTLQAIGAEAAQPVAEFFPSFWLFGCFGGLKREWGKPPLLFNLRSLSDITCHYLIAVWKGISFRGSGINLNGCSALYPQ